MTGSRLRIFLASAAVLALTAPFSPVRAQWTSDKPPVLHPDDYPPEATEETPSQKSTKPSTAPHPLGPAQNSGDQNGAPTSAPQGGTEVQSLPPPVQRSSLARPAPVEVSTLGTAEGSPTGTLDATNGGFTDRIWSGSERQEMEDLLAKSPLVSPDPVLRDLNRRAILTKASAPPGQAKRAFVTTRIERLMDAGFVPEAAQIAATAVVSNDEDFARTQAKAILYANRGQDVCGPATAMRQTGGDTFWMRLRIYCAAISGDTATADLTRDVLKAQGHSDAAFDTLLNNVVAKKAVMPSTIPQAGAIHVFLLQQAGLPVGDALASKMGTPVNLLLVLDKRNAPRARFEAAERIVMTGALAPAELRGIADAQDLPLNRLANAVSEAPNLPYFMGQVVLRRAAAIEQRSDEKARIMALALSLGAKAHALPLTASFQGDLLATLKPTAATKEYARDFARALVLAKRYEAAWNWAAGDPVMKTVVAIASQDGARLAAAQKDLSGFAVSLAKNPPDADPDRSYKALVLGLAAALGMSLPPDANAAVVQTGSWEGKHPDGGQMRLLQQAADMPERRGEAILRLTSAIRDIGLANLSPNATIEYVNLLNGMNETKAARALALEAMAEYAPGKAATTP